MRIGNITLTRAALYDATLTTLVLAVALLLGLSILDAITLALVAEGLWLVLLYRYQINHSLHALWQEWTGSRADYAPVLDEDVDLGDIANDEDDQ